jgi:pyruvate dehydrogenase E1 component subunit beta
VLKEGRDITVVGYSRATVIALDIARRLEADGISAEVIDLRNLRPLDQDTVCASVRNTSRAVIVEDDWLSYGTGAEIAATIAEAAFGYLDGTTMALTLSIDHRCWTAPQVRPSSPTLES